MKLRPAVLVVLLVAAGCSPFPRSVPVTARPARAAPPVPAPAPAELPSLRLRLSASSVSAGGCVEATVSISAGAGVGARVQILGGIRRGPAVWLVDGLGHVPICEGWTESRGVRLRAVAPGAGAASEPVRLRVRPAPWMLRVRRLLGRAPMAVSVGDGERLLYGHRGETSLPPASNEKLLLSMALLDRYGPGFRIPTSVLGSAPFHGTVRGDLWLVGHGDPEFGPAAVDRLAHALRSRGIRRVQGSVVGVTTTFRRDRWAPGWRRIALRYIGLPTALTFRGSAGSRGFVFDPERRAAAALTGDLKVLGVSVNGLPRTGGKPPGGHRLVSTPSAPLVDILRRQNVASLNLDAEVLDKMLGGAAWGPPGSIAKGARTIQAWAKDHGVAVVAHDGAGLSYADRITTDAMVRLLGIAGDTPWGETLRTTLPSAGEGTLSGRLGGLRVRAKTGTLLGGVSALSGWVWLERSRRWAEFSILSRGLSKTQAVALEDEVVRIIAVRA